MRTFTDSGKTEQFNSQCASTGVARGRGDCYGYALVATARAELMIDPRQEVWDAAPMPVILEEAGGKYTSFTGAADIRGGTGLATNGHLHATVLKLVGG
jgi:fructose-1,6-bisphosphatase/inositol monophosphatase family enzyme